MTDWDYFIREQSENFTIFPQPAFWKFDASHPCPCLIFWQIFTQSVSPHTNVCEELVFGITTREIGVGFTFVEILGVGETVSEVPPVVINFQGLILALDGIFPSCAATLPPS